MDILNSLSPVLNLVVSAGSAFGLYLSLNNRIIKSESKTTELETRLNRRDTYDEKLREKVDAIQTTLTEIATIVRQLKHESETNSPQRNSR
jgi:hypothetical protein